jgi:hypothetical protein
MTNIEKQKPRVGAFLAALAEAGIMRPLILGQSTLLPIFEAQDLEPFMAGEMPAAPAGLRCPELFEEE